MQTVNKQQEKMNELTNLIAQYDNGERTNINAEEYPQWILIVSMLKNANIEEATLDDFVKNPTHYKIDEGAIVYNDNWEQEEEEQKLKRIAKLHITKQDFYDNFCVPVNISYETLLNKIAELNLKPAWELCNHVYFGRIENMLDALPLGKTKEEIIKTFETIMAKNEE